MISHVSAQTPAGVALMNIKQRRERIKSLLSNMDELEEPFTAEKSGVSKTPFERLTASIKKTDLSIQGKKTKIHYVKYALSQMDEDQAKKFEKNMNILLNFSNKKSSKGSLLSSIQKNIYFSKKDLKDLKKIEDLIKKEEQELKDILPEKDQESKKEFGSLLDEVKSILDSSKKKTNKYNFNLRSYEDNLIDDYIAKLNKNFDAITNTENQFSQSIDIPA